MWWVIFAIFVIIGLGSITQATEKVAKTGQQQAALTADLIMATVSPDAFKEELVKREAATKRKQLWKTIMRLMVLFGMLCFAAYACTPHPFN